MEDNKNKIKLMCFDTDDDFYNFCVVPELVVKTYVTPTGEIGKYADFDLSQAYYDALDNDVKFIIKDINSRIINRNNKVTYKTCSKSVKNLYNWQYEKYFKKMCPEYEIYPQNAPVDGAE